MNFEQEYENMHVQMTEKLRSLAAYFPANVFLCVLLSSCVSSDHSALGIASEDTQQVISTPQLAVLAGAPATTDAQLVESGSSPIAEQQSPTNQPSNVPQLSPLKQKAKAPENTPASQLAIAEQVETTDPAVKQVENIANNQTAQTALSSGAATTTAGAETTVTTAQPTFEDVKASPVNGDTSTVTTAETAQEPIVVAAVPTEPQQIKKPSLLERLFGTRKKKVSAEKDTLKERLAPNESVSASNLNSESDDLSKQLANAASKPKTKTKIKTITRNASLQARLDNSDKSAALPGVKSNNEIFGIKEDPQVTENKQSTKLAALGNLGRLSPKGLRLQHDKVQVACLKPGVLKILKLVERKYGKKPIITSGYRSPKRNRRAGGARNSQHVFCKAVDIQVEGISKWTLAKYLRSIPGRGGVGTYCRTKSVHFDIGSKRDWHHPCRRSSKRKRKKA